MRRASRRDASEPSIVAALEAAGAIVLKKLPVDLLVWHRGVWTLLECKTPGRNKGQVMQSRQKEQAAFVKAFDVPVVSTPREALAAVLTVEQETVKTIMERIPL